VTAAGTLKRVAVAVSLLASAAQAAPPAQSHPSTFSDRGVYAHLDPQVATILPSWVDGTGVRVHVDRRRNVLSLFRARDAIGAIPIQAPPERACPGAVLECLGIPSDQRAALGRLLPDSNRLPDTDGAADAALPSRDSDGDGIPDAVDILRGGKKTVLLATPYIETARKLAYPGGDMPPSEGVCTDVIVRAFRNAGVDLQKEVFEDAGRAPKAYPAIRTRNPNIDHRRVRNLLPYFQRHYHRVAAGQTLLPGDVVFMDTFPGRAGIEHVGLVSDRPGPSGRPLIINAWTNGFKTSEMDLLESVAAPAVFRVPASAAPSAPLPPPKVGFRLPPDHRQAVLLVSDSWTATTGELSWWRRDKTRWRRERPPVRAMLGAAGMGWGDGLLQPELARTLAGPRKQEGDRRAPAGLFRLSAITGYRARAQVHVRLPYRQATNALRCVDDPRSPHYNRVVLRPRDPLPDWSSDEPMLRDDQQYALTIAIDHNRAPVRPGAGSCIFLHGWPAPDTSSPGCTMLDAGDVARLAAWLDPAAAPVLVQLPRSTYEALAAAWDLPR
jgi:uncharacterized protein YijF (DUF1287 family)/L,D-peptidoglycan transpeptidase YkuD (ErfK/YbiS/YcfS/YnhG family)